MKSEIIVAKRELYNKLKELSEVNGAGIREKGGLPYIVIFLSKKDKKTIEKIPKQFKGNKVVAVVQPIARAL